MTRLPLPSIAPVLVALLAFATPFGAKASSGGNALFLARHMGAVLPDPLATEPFDLSGISLRTGAHTFAPIASLPVSSHARTHLRAPVFFTGQSLSLQGISPGMASRRPLGIRASLVHWKGRDRASIDALPFPIRHDLSNIRPAPRPHNLVAKFRTHLPRSMRGQSAPTCMQLALYHEARGEPVRGQRAVASVILQRTRLPSQFGKGICGVISKRNMFSFVKPNLATPAIRDLDAWLKAGRIAREMIAHGPLAQLKGADHYHALSVHPAWGRKMHRVARIGAHIFYADPARNYPM